MSLSRALYHKIKRGESMRTIDDIAREQAELLGTEMMDLMESAAEAQEIFSLDELEEYAKENRV